MSTSNDRSITTEAKPSPGSGSLWRNRDYLTLWTGQTISETGSGVSQLAFPLLILALTHSPAQAGFVAALRSLPYLLVILPAGALVDRWNRKRVMVYCDTGRALSLISIPIALLLGHLTIVQLYITSLIEGTLYVFFDLAGTSSLPNIVTKEQLPTAVAQNLVMGGVADSLGPPLGGVLYSIGRMIPFLADAISYIVSIISLLFIKTRFQHARTDSAVSTLRTEIVVGLAWLWRQRVIRALAILTSGINFVFPTSMLIVIVLAQKHHASSALIGVIFALGGMSYLLGALLGSPIRRRLRLVSIIRWTCWLFVLFWPLFAFATNLLILAAVLGVLTCIRPIYGVAQLSYRLALIPDELQGRVNSVFRLVAIGTLPLGQALTGVLIQGIGVIPTILIFWLCFIVLAVYSVTLRFASQ